MLLRSLIKTVIVFFLTSLLLVSSTKTTVALEQFSFYTTIIKKNNLLSLLTKLRSIGITNVDASGIILNPTYRNTLEQTDISYINHDFLPMILDHSCQRAWQIVNKDPTKLLLWRCKELARTGRVEYMTYENLISSVTNYLNKPEVINNKNITAYYILDDWEASTDPGGARTILEKVHELIESANEKYNLNRKTICYFMAWMAKKGEKNYTGIGKNAYNFTSRGCDYIAINSYAAFNYGGSTNNDDYDWDMTFLPEIKNRLMNQPDPYEDWNPEKTPFIGGVQTYGIDPATHPINSQYAILPRRNDIKRQALGFCQQEAYGIWFWPWHGYVGGGGNKYISPDTNPNLYDGVIDAIATCKNYWRNNPTPTPTNAAKKPGDANGDGKVNEVDYLIWLNHYGTTTTKGPEDGDYNSPPDGKVDGIDYVIMISNY